MNLFLLWFEGERLLVLLLSRDIFFLFTWNHVDILVDCIPDTTLPLLAESRHWKGKCESGAILFSIYPIGCLTQW